MNSYLFSRSLGSIGPQTVQRAETHRLLHAVQPAPGIKFDGSLSSVPSQYRERERDDAQIWAHAAGVNTIVIDKFEGKHLLSGGSESSIKLWDLEASENTSKQCLNRPAGVVHKSSAAHKFGITHLSFYPFDSFAFLSSSYDHTLKIYSTENLSVSASFDLDSVVYSHALSPVGQHLLVACATQHPAVRLVDLRSSASVHSLAGHQGAVLSVAWSPQREHVFASGGSDGTVRLWDIRRSVGSLGILDLEDAVGIVGEDGFGKNAHSRERGKAHIGACNGVVWTDSGNHIVTAGHDERIRVWDSATGANELSHFGPIIKNTILSTLLPMLAPSHLVSPGQQIMFFPNEGEILMFDIFDGTLKKRLRASGVTVAQSRGSAGQRNIRNRVTSLAWRAGSVEMYSASSDGTIRAWLPRTKAEVLVEEEEASEARGEAEEDENRKRKRETLDAVYRDLTRQKITFT